MNNNLILTAACALLSITSIQAAPTKTTLPVPLISQESATQNSITLHVAADAVYGAPYGYVVQWRKPNETEFTCDKSYNAPLPANGSNSITFNRLEADLCFDFTCSTDYEFRLFAHGGKDYFRSAFSEVITVSTSPCEGQCVYGLGYWKNHPDLWPVTSLQLGTGTYDETQLMAMLQASPKGNGMIILLHQLIPALLNQANGADTSVITDALVDAHALIGSADATTGYMSPDNVSASKALLESFNEGETGPGVCPDVD